MLALAVPSAACVRNRRSIRKKRRSVAAYTGHTTAAFDEGMEVERCKDQEVEHWFNQTERETRRSFWRPNWCLWFVHRVERYWAPQTPRLPNLPNRTVAPTSTPP